MTKRLPKAFRGDDDSDTTPDEEPPKAPRRERRTGNYYLNTSPEGERRVSPPPFQALVRLHAPMGPTMTRKIPKAFQRDDVLNITPDEEPPKAPRRERRKQNYYLNSSPDGEKRVPSPICQATNPLHTLTRTPRQDYRTIPITQRIDGNSTHTKSISGAQKSNDVRLPRSSVLEQIITPVKTVELKRKSPPTSLSPCYVRPNQPYKKHSLPSSLTNTERTVTPPSLHLVTPPAELERSPVTPSSPQRLSGEAFHPGGPWKTPPPLQEDPFLDDSDWNTARPTFRISRPGHTPRGVQLDYILPPSPRPCGHRDFASGSRLERQPRDTDHSFPFDSPTSPNDEPDGNLPPTPSSPGYGPRGFPFRRRSGSFRPSNGQLVTPPPRRSATPPYTPSSPAPIPPIERCDAFATLNRPHDWDMMSFTIIPDELPSSAGDLSYYQTLNNLITLKNAGNYTLRIARGPNLITARLEDKDAIIEAISRTSQQRHLIFPHRNAEILSTTACTMQVGELKLALVAAAGSIRVSAYGMKMSLRV